MRWRLWGYRVARRLGVRFAFVLGTLPVPYHPLVRLVPLVPVALVVWGGLTGDVSPWSLLLAAAVLGLMLSVPVLFHVLVVFRVPLLQGSLVAGALALVAVDVASGRLAWPWSLLPAAYALVYLAQVVGGFAALARLQRSQREVTRVDPPFGLVVAEGPERHDVARWLLADSAVTMVCVDTTTWMRLDPAAVEQLQHLQEQVPPEYPIDGEVVKVPGAESGPVAVRTHPAGRSSWRLVQGDRLRTWEVAHGDHRQLLASGRATVVGWLPLLVCFYYVALFGGRSRWFVGFPRRSAVDLGEDRDVLLRAFTPRPDPPTYADPAGPLAVLGRKVAEARATYLAALDDLERTPDEELRRSQLAGLSAVRGAGTAGTAARLCDLLERGKRLSSRPLAEAAARALAEVPGEELRSLGRPFLTMMSSRILGLQWEITPDLDVAPLPRDLPRWGDVAGFGLVTQVPDLYRRLGELDHSQVPAVLDGLAAEAGWTPALREARETYVSGHPD